jgi:hypothetical protein
MDNVDEVDPTAIIVSARDFPRHWKILVQFVRYEKPKETCPIIILKGDNFPLEETSRAFFLGVSGIVSESMEDPNEIERLKSILSRYIPVDEKRKSHRYYAEEWNRFGLMISNPADKTVIWGEVKTVSNTGLSFSPAWSMMMKDITLNMELDGCSLRVGDAILSPVCRLVRTGRIVSLEFVSFPGDEKDIFDGYLESLPILELKYRKEHTAETRTPAPVPRRP